jgi:TPP-dependent pyruvate/acetoin dehydrogenase alpha subunit
MRKRQAIGTLIDFSDMSRLRVVAHLEARGAEELAQEVVQDIRTKPARKIAELLTKRGTTSNGRLKEVARNLQASVQRKVEPDRSSKSPDRSLKNLPSRTSKAAGPILSRKRS